VDTISPAQRDMARRYADELLAKLDAGKVDEVERLVAIQLDTEREMRRLIDSGEAKSVADAQRILEAEIAAREEAEQHE